MQLIERGKVAATVAVVYLLTALSVHAQQPATGGTQSITLHFNAANLIATNTPGCFYGSSKRLIVLCEGDAVYSNNTSGNTISNNIPLQTASNSPPPRPTWRPSRDGINYMRAACRDAVGGNTKQHICAQRDALQKHYNECERNRDIESFHCKEYSFFSRRYSKKYQHYPPQKHWLDIMELGCASAGGIHGDATICRDYLALSRLYNRCSDIYIYHNQSPHPCANYRNEGLRLAKLYRVWGY